MRTERIPQALLEARMPQPIVVTVARRDVVPGGVGVGRHAVAGGLLRQVGSGHGTTYNILQAQQHHKNGGIHAGQSGINGKTQHDGIENQAEKEL